MADGDQKSKTQQAFWRGRGNLVTPKKTLNIIVPEKPVRHTYIGSETFWEYRRREDERREEEAALRAPPPPEAHEEAKSNGLCSTLCPPKGRDKSSYVCSRHVVREGRCTMHYLRDVLRVPYNVGPSPYYRPFYQYQVPLGAMTDAQHEALSALPVETPYDICIDAMNAADPSTVLVPIPRRPKRRSR